MEARALEAEECIPRSSTKEEALQNAILATEIYMKAIELASNGSERDRLKSKCMKVLARAERIKQLKSWGVPKKQDELVRTVKQLKVPLSDRALSTREEFILHEGSKLHGLTFPPWISEPGEDEFQNMSGGGLYTDLSEMKLSDSQQKVFAGWRRPHEVFRKLRAVNGMTEAVIEPTMIASSNIDLVQDVTADCSVVASLCAAVASAGDGFEKLLCRIFYPYDSILSRPMVSRNGKYVFRFHFNGCFRKVTIDDRLPDSKSSRILHVFDRQNPGLLWPALLEKAYLKVRGGYDFPGSNSGTDLWMLTGWLPEQIFLQSDDINPQELWNRIFKSYSYGDVIITLGTGRLNQQEEEGLGLAGEHDYAVLNMKEVGGQQLLLVKNPWCDGTIWKGSGSIGPGTETWDEAYTKDTNAMLKENSQMSPGTFWISVNEVIQNFESLYLNWNPGLFRYRQDYHFSWAIQSFTSPACLTHNPQYLIKSVNGGPVWILLSRHFSTEEGDILNSSAHAKAARSPLGFISLYVFSTDGRRVHLSDGALVRGPFVDSPQTLTRLDIPPMTCYTLVIAQQDLPLPKYSFTLSAYSRDPVTVDHALNPHLHNKTVSAVWTSRTAGGNAGSPSYPSNPQFSISVKSVTDITLLLETNQLDLPIHVKMVRAGGERVAAVTARDIIGESGDYRRGCALAIISNVPAGIYTIICSTFEQGQTGSFTLRVESMIPCEVRPIAAETAGRLSLRLPTLLFLNGIDRMLAPVMVSRMTCVKIVARYGGVTGLRARSPLKVILEQGQGPHKTVLASSCDGKFSDAPAGVRIADVDISPQTGGREGVWLVVERFRSGQLIDEIEVEILSEALIEVGPWGNGNG